MSGTVRPALASQQARVLAIDASSGDEAEAERQAIVGESDEEILAALVEDPDTDKTLCESEPPALGEQGEKLNDIG